MKTYANAGTQTEWHDPLPLAKRPTTTPPTPGKSRSLASERNDGLSARVDKRSDAAGQSEAGATATRRLKAIKGHLQGPERSTPAAPRQFAEVGSQTMRHDIHNHSPGPGYAATQIADVTRTLSENVRTQIALFDQAGVDKFVWAPIPSVIIQGEAVNAGCCGTDGSAHLDKSKTYYMDDKYRDGEPMTGEAYDAITTEGKQHYNTSVDWQVGKAYAEIRAADKDLPPHEQLAPRIFPAITGINLGDANSVQSMLRLKSEYPDTFHIIGEITMHKEFVGKQNLDYKAGFGPEAPINDILKFAARSGMPVVLHCDSSDAETCIKTKSPGKGEYFKEIDELVARHPNTKIVHAHMGGIGKFAPPGENHVAQLRELLRKHDNYSIDMSWDVVAENYSPVSKETDPVRKAADEAARKTRIEDMAALIREYPTRFIMGSDALISRNSKSISATYDLYANRGTQEPEKLGLFDYLDPDGDYPRVLSGNFDTLLTDAQTASRKYEGGLMKQDLAELQSAIERNGRTPNKWS
ncbi:amidohydrolase family protein [Cupriavidus pauculus]|uniref:Amidohydrolase family protein n=1 Tax=Cupriavidus pauculus TaxID=82633 RepID=A0A5P2HCB9_9BURK|nr:amidohydrolase family protein [Cupriavidus pauculus]QET05234.1 amidohydrolase family protein [Cupriavidus pauculus]